MWIKSHLRRARDQSRVRNQRACHCGWRGEGLPEANIRNVEHFEIIPELKHGSLNLKQMRAGMQLGDLSPIGQPVDQPQVVTVEVAAPNGLTPVLTKQITAVAAGQLEHVFELTDRLVRGEVDVY